MFVGRLLLGLGLALSSLFAVLATLAGFAFGALFALTAAFAFSLLAALGGLGFALSLLVAAIVVGA